jgi:hypothetical protein
VQWGVDVVLGHCNSRLDASPPHFKHDLKENRQVVPALPDCIFGTKRLIPEYLQGIYELEYMTFILRDFLLQLKLRDTGRGKTRGISLAPAGNVTLIVQPVAIPTELSISSIFILEPTHTSVTLYRKSSNVEFRINGWVMKCLSLPVHPTSWLDICC